MPSRRSSRDIGNRRGDPTTIRPSRMPAGCTSWAMERIAVLYDVRQLDKKDWYRWGAEILRRPPAEDGVGAKRGAIPDEHPILNTALALLFLRRANLTPDLSRRLSVDTELLTAKVDNKVAPKVSPGDLPSQLQRQHPYDRSP